MITTVTLNPCIDQTLIIETFTHGGMNRVIDGRRDIAGKGINVSAALAGLGVPSRCMGINYNENGRLLDDRLTALGLEYNFIRAEGAVRTNIKLYEQDTGRMTEINQPGAYVSPERVAALTEAIKKTPADLLVLSGSRPRGIAADIYARILAETKAPAIVDTEGEALSACLFGDTCKRRPYLIKPNLFELENAFGVTLGGTGPREAATAVADFARRLLGGGLKIVCVSMGKDGAVLVGEGGAYFAPALAVPVRGVQGAGDAMVAGMAMAMGIMARGMSEEPLEATLLRYAVAAASASVVRDGTQMCERDGFEAMLAQVRVEVLG